MFSHFFVSSCRYSQLLDSSCSFLLFIISSWLDLIHTISHCNNSVAISFIAISCVSQYYSYFSDPRTLSNPLFLFFEFIFAELMTRIANVIQFDSVKILTFDISTIRKSSFPFFAWFYLLNFLFFLFEDFRSSWYFFSHNFFSVLKSSILLISINRIRYFQLGNSLSTSRIGNLLSCHEFRFRVILLCLSIIPIISSSNATRTRMHTCVHSFLLFFNTNNLIHLLTSRTFDYINFTFLFFIIIINLSLNKYLYIYIYIYIYVLLLNIESY